MRAIVRLATRIRQIALWPLAMLDAVVKRANRKTLRRAIRDRSLHTKRLSDPEDFIKGVYDQRRHLFRDDRVASVYHFKVGQERTHASQQAWFTSSEAAPGSHVVAT